MKKKYISPVSKCFAVNSTEMIALSKGELPSNPDVEVDTKEEKAGAGIWDLY